MDILETILSIIGYTVIFAIGTFFVIVAIPFIIIYCVWYTPDPSSYQGRIHNGQVKN